MYDILHGLGTAYAAYRIIQDSGMWLAEEGNEQRLGYIQAWLMSKGLA